MDRWILPIANRVAATAILTSVAVLPCGCCTLARLWCGPDRSAWISERYETADLALGTLQESLRRADRQTLFRCLSEQFKRREQLDPIAIEVAWRRLTEQFDGIHLLGTAEVAASRELSADAREYTLAVAGRRFALLFVRQPYWEVRWSAADGQRSDGAFVRSVHSHARIEARPDGQSDLRIALPPIGGSPALDAISFAGIGVEWKVDRIEDADAAGN